MKTTNAGPRVHVEVRLDGTHVRWHEPHPRAATGALPRTLGVRLSDVHEGVPGAAGLLRLSAAACAMAGSDLPRPALDRWLKLLAGGEPMPPEARPLLDEALSVIMRDHRKELDKKLERVRQTLREAVIGAHERLPAEEVEQITRDALAEFVMKG